jgi:hypothetical protein
MGGGRPRPTPWAAPHARMSRQWGPVRTSPTRMRQSRSGGDQAPVGGIRAGCSVRFGWTTARGISSQGEHAREGALREARGGNWNQPQEQRWRCYNKGPKTNRHRPCPTVLIPTYRSQKSNIKRDHITTQAGFHHQHSQALHISTSLCKTPFPPSVPGRFWLAFIFIIPIDCTIFFLGNTPECVFH